MSFKSAFFFFGYDTVIDTNEQIFILFLNISTALRVYIDPTPVLATQSVFQNPQKKILVVLPTKLLFFF